MNSDRLFRKNDTGQWFVSVETGTNGEMTRRYKWIADLFGETPTELCRLGEAKNFTKDGYLCKWGVRVEAYLSVNPHHTVQINEIINKAEKTQEE